MRKFREMLGRAVAYLGVCIVLGERPAAWMLYVWSKAQMERAKRELAEREQIVRDMLKSHGFDNYGAGLRTAERDYTELPALTGHKAPPEVN